MILPFSQIEEARRNPARFGKAFAKPGGHFNSRNFRTYIVAAVRRFHGGMAKADVLQYFEQKCSEKLTTIGYWRQRTDNYNQMLDAYCDAFSPANTQYIESHKRMSIAVGPHMLTGEVDRFDLRDPTGYRATAIQLAPSKWRDELRWPLIQKGIALDMGCAPSEVEVGVFSFDNGRYGYKSYSDADITDAETEAEAVLTTVEQNLP